MADYIGKQNTAMTITFGIPTGATPVCQFILDGSTPDDTTHSPAQVGTSNFWTLLLTAAERNGALTTVIVTTTGVVTFQYFTIQSDTPQTGDAYPVVVALISSHPTVITVALPVVVAGEPVKIVRGDTYDSALNNELTLTGLQMSITLTDITGYVMEFVTNETVNLSATATLVGSSNPYSVTVALSSANTSALPTTANRYRLVAVGEIAGTPPEPVRYTLVEGALVVSA